MSAIQIDPDHSLAGALRAMSFTDDQLYLVLRDDAGKVSWSGVLDGWKVEDRAMTVEFTPVGKHIDKLADRHRAALQVEAIQRGIL